MPGIIIYTDGSCHTQRRIGAWAALIFIDGVKLTLTGIAQDTTQNAMELTAVIKALEYIGAHYKELPVIPIITDSQYVARLAGREEKLKGRNFVTKKGIEIRNQELVKRLLHLNSEMNLTFIKVKAHQAKTEEDNYNIEVDKLARRICREEVKGH